ncbi:MAG TPA: TIR domain-containing protein [Actinomycetota bacterium]|nr:TIR domain-containing protein [Actinomycetota bacterium]
MLAGRTAVFLSCSEAYKLSVACKFRDTLDAMGIKGIIVTEEPNLVGVFTLEDKVDAYLDASDAFVALCTPDNTLSTGDVETRRNIIDEIQRARSRPLRDRVAVFKSQAVKLPSNIQPVYERLDPDDLAPALEKLRLQIEAWDLRSSHPAGPAIPRPIHLNDPTKGLQVGEPEQAERRVLNLFLDSSKDDQRAYVERLVGLITDERSSQTDQLIAGALLEAALGLDPELIGTEPIEKLARSDDPTCRIAAVGALWTLALTLPGRVPLDLVAILCRPAVEDWYVWAPALATLQELALSRPEALAIIAELTSSGNVDDRYAATRALLDLAKVRPEIIPPSIVEKLKRDREESIRESARVLEAEAARASAHARDRAYRRFFI